MNKSNTEKIKGSAFLFFASLIWGSTFVAQSMGMDYIQPFTFNAVRFFIGGLVLLPVIALFRREPKALSAEDIAKKAVDRRNLIWGGVVCGVLIFAATGLQQIGLVYTTAGKAGFLTALYVVLVPIIGLFFKKKPSIFLWFGVAFAVTGLYFLSMNEQFTLGNGDLPVLICALIFSFQILAVDHYSPLVDGVKLSCIQFFVASVLSTVTMFLFEKPDLTSIWSARMPLLYTGILACGIAYTFQILGQKTTPPAVASVVFGLESVFAAVFGWLILNEQLTQRELFGAGLVLVAVMLSQITPKKRARLQSRKASAKL
ncbi:MAG TPA: DMT family transporter [Oscillospiraceae bacterium]|nr:DMT family transporter [Oscillospiraceae bacterium]HPF56255.1 DMT family transporter [Clostridiales bacterium]HPK34501.1 DMT family transporter [Oscillospiraceae bacterium]HPR74729.1 DMT family transporter [Oscillospiraceae bacterium]